MKKLGRPTEERRGLWTLIAGNNFSINGQNDLTLYQKRGGYDRLQKHGQEEPPQAGGQGQQPLGVTL